MVSSHSIERLKHLEYERGRRAGMEEASTRMATGCPTIAATRLALARVPPGARIASLGGWRFKSDTV